MQGSADGLQPVPFALAEHSADAPSEQLPAVIAASGQRQAGSPDRLAGVAGHLQRLETPLADECWPLTAAADQPALHSMIVASALLPASQTSTAESAAVPSEPQEQPPLECSSDMPMRVCS